jgi:hypothetical protein
MKTPECLKETRSQIEKVLNQETTYTNKRKRVWTLKYYIFNNFDFTKLSEIEEVCYQLKASFDFRMHTEVNPLFKTPTYVTVLVISIYRTYIKDDPYNLKWR